MQIIMEVTERQIIPGETARFPFTAPPGEGLPPILEFHIISDNQNFNPGWAHVIRSTDDTHFPRYVLEIRPADIRRSSYGTYPLRIYWGIPGSYRYGEGRCTLTIKPCVRLTAKPTFKTWPGGMLSFSLENCGGVDIDVSVTVSHHGSNWSKGWEFELRTEDGPFEFSETFEPPADGKGGKFELDISAEGISIVRIPIQARRFFIARKHVAAAAVVLAGVAVGSTLALAGTGPAPTSQSIAFTSTPPASPAVGGTYVVAATGGGSGNPVTFTIDPSSTNSACSISGSLVTFGQPGNCVIDANEAGNDKYQPAPQAQQTITAQGGTKIAQSIAFTSTPPASPAVGGTYVVAATGGGSGNPVTFTIDPSSTNSACSISGSLVTFGQPGNCVIDANEAGNDKYQPAPQAQQTITAQGGTKIAQSIAFTSTPPASPAVGGTYVVAATGGGSGNPVTFTIDPSSTNSACSISGSLVTFGQPGNCVIDANEAGNDKYQPASQAQQTITVNGTKIAQSITFTSVPRSEVEYNVAATGGGSGNPVTFTIDPSSTNSACSISGSLVTFGQPGNCVIDANEAGNDKYQPAPQAQQTITVKAAQSISFPAQPTGWVGTPAALSATGGGSGNPVVFSVDPASETGVCNVSGTNGTTVNYSAPGTCVIDANQAGNDIYQPAPQAQQTIMVNNPIQLRRERPARLNRGPAPRLQRDDGTRRSAVPARPSTPSRTSKGSRRRFVPAPVDTRETLPSI